MATIISSIYTRIPEANPIGRIQFTTEQGGNVSLAELKSATHGLDERTYRQEFQASSEKVRET